MKNWLNKLMKTSLGVNNMLYLLIYTTIEREMTKLNMLKQKLNTINSKGKLHLTFLNIID